MAEPASYQPPQPAMGSGTDLAKHMEHQAHL